MLSSHWALAAEAARVRPRVIKAVVNPLILALITASLPSLRPPFPGIAVDDGEQHAPRGALYQTLQEAGSSGFPVCAAEIRPVAEGQPRECRRSRSSGTATSTPFDRKNAGRPLPQ